MEWRTHHAWMWFAGQQLEHGRHQRRDDEPQAMDRVPGKRTLTQLLVADAQAAADAGTRDSGVALGRSATTIARTGTSGAGSPLPYLATVQQLFGRHDLSRVTAHSDAQAVAAAASLGAKAFAHGDRVVFAGTPDLHTVAHEAAHVVQQRAGVQLAGGVGAVGDEHERHADAVADKVVRGEAVEALLDRYRAASDCGANGSVQMKKSDLVQSLGLDDLPKATAYFEKVGVSKKSVEAFVCDSQQPAYERARVEELWNRGYDIGGNSWGFKPPKIKQPRRKEPSKPKKRARSPSPSPPKPKRQRVDQQISFAYWNMERLGLKSNPAKMQRYVDYVLDVLETYHPTFMAFEEMGDGVAIFGKLLLDGDLFARYEQHIGSKTPEVDDSSESESETDDNFDTVFDTEVDLEPEEDEENQQAYNELMQLFLARRDERLKQQGDKPDGKKGGKKDGEKEGESFKDRAKGSYPVKREYGFLPGPQFYSSNFREYYPLIFDKAVVIGTPELLVTRPRDLSEIRGGLGKHEKVIVPYVEPRPFQSGKDEDDDNGDDSRTPRGAAFWKIRMKSLHHNTRLPKRDGREVPPPDDEVLEIYLGVVHTSPGMLNPDIDYILEAASELVPENKPVIVGGDWYMQRGSKRTFERLQDDEVWALGLPHGTTNYKAGKVCQTADHAVFSKTFVTLNAPPIRVQPSSQIPFEGLTGIDDDEMCGERDTAPTAKEVKDEVGSDHTNIFMSMTVRPDRPDNDQDGSKGKSKPPQQPTASPLIAHMKSVLAKPRRSGTKRKVEDQTIIANGGTLHVNKTLGDGNCFYHSIFECLTGTRSSGESQQQVRSEAVRMMLTDPTVQAHLFGHRPDEHTMSEAIGELLQDGLWTEDFAPSFVAEALNLEICVVTPTGDPYYTASPTFARPGMRTIVCVFTGNHYNSCTSVALPQPDSMELVSLQ